MRTYGTYLLTLNFPYLGKIQIYQKIHAVKEKVNRRNVLKLYKNFICKLLKIYNIEII